MTTLIDGKKTAQDIKNEIAARVAEIKQVGGKQPHLAAILVGEDGASQTYVGAKVKACEEVGFTSTLVRLAAEVSEEELLRTVEEINQNPDIDGLIVQLPLPAHISVDKVTNRIRPEKDVDGFTPANVGRMTLNWPAYVAATPYGIVELLKRYQIETSGKHCVVIGRSHIVGSPMSILMARNGYPGNATVTLTHSKTKDLAAICRTADILIVAIGKPEFVTADMVKPGAVVIDVGEPHEFAAGHVGGSKNIPFGQLEEKLPGLVKNKALPVILVCPLGARAGRAVAVAKKMGYEQAQSLGGGLKSWREANLPVEKA